MQYKKPATERLRAFCFLWRYNPAKAKNGRHVGSRSNSIINVLSSCIFLWNDFAGISDNDAVAGDVLIDKCVGGDHDIIAYFDPT